MKRAASVFLAVVLCVTAIGAQERVDEAAIARMKIEGFQHSQVMDTLSWISDVYGPRLTGSTNYRKAAEWARDRLTRWGLANAHLEPWGTFGPAWSVERFSVEMVEPTYTRIVAYPNAWTPSTPGVVRGTPVPVVIDSKDDFPKYRGKLKGAIVMLGRPSEAGSIFDPPGRRFTDAQLAERGAAMDPGQPASYQAEEKEFVDFLGKPRAVMQFLKDEGIAALRRAKQPRRQRDRGRRHRLLPRYRSAVSRVRDLQGAIRPHPPHARPEGARHARAEPDDDVRQLGHQGLQHHRGDSGHRSGAGRPGGDARRALRLVARGHRRGGQRRRLGRGDGGRPYPEGDWREAAPDDPDGALGRRGGGLLRLARLREARTSATRRRAR